MKRSLKNDIIQHLTKKGNYETDVDDMVIDILIKNIAYAETLCELLAEQGLQVTILNGNGFETTKENPAFGTYMKCLDSIHTCSAKLGISRKDRIALKLIEEKKSDSFDEDFN
jgi:P27 family predicted phage terminase small subunit